MPHTNLYTDLLNATNQSLSQLKKAKTTLEVSDYPSAAIQFYRTMIQDNPEAKRVFEGKHRLLKGVIKYNYNEYRSKYCLNYDKDPQHQLCTALMYLMGLGVARDDKQAYYILQNLLHDLLDDKNKKEQIIKQEKETIAIACHVIALLYHRGRGVPLDHQKAIYWYKKAAQEGNVAAMNDLGELYLSDGCDKEALDWFNQAKAKGNSAAAKANIGCMYQDGRGVPKNNKMALYYFNEAAIQGNPAARCHLGLMYVNNQVDSWVNIKQARICFQAAADLGDYNGMYYLASKIYGRISTNPMKKQKNLLKAIYWSTRLLEQSNYDLKKNAEKEIQNLLETNSNINEPKTQALTFSAFEKNML